MDLLSCAHIQLVVYIPTMFNRCIEKTCSQIPIMLLESISLSYLHFLHVQPTHSPNPLSKCSLLCITVILQNSQNKHHILSRLIAQIFPVYTFTNIHISPLDHQPQPSNGRRFCPTNPGEPSCSSERKNWKLKISSLNTKVTWGNWAVVSMSLWMRPMKR